MANFDPADYETVDSRIKRFYADHPDGCIRTELLSNPNEIGTAVVLAYLYTDHGEILRSTGMAFEQAGQGFVNKTSHLENCETSAIGRALANYNYSGDKRPSREEMDKTQGKETVVDNSAANRPNQEPKAEKSEQYRAIIKKANAGGFGEGVVAVMAKANRAEKDGDTDTLEKILADD